MSKSTAAMILSVLITICVLTLLVLPSLEPKEKRITSCFPFDRHPAATQTAIAVLLPSSRSLRFCATDFAKATAEEAYRDWWPLGH